jgi:hypothetical protein
MKMRPSEQIYMTVLRASMRVMLVSRESCSQRPHISNTLARGTPHSDLCGGRTSEIKVSHSLSPLQVKTTIKHRRNPHVVEVWSVTETFLRIFSYSIDFYTVPSAVSWSDRRCSGSYIPLSYALDAVLVLTWAHRYSR